MTDAGDLLFGGPDLKGVRLRPYRTGDERGFQARPDFADAYRAAGSVLPNGPKWSLCDGAAVVGVGGVEPLGDGHWGAWAYLSDLTPRQWVFARRFAGAAVAYVRRAFKAKAIQAVAADRPGAAELLERLGFEPKTVWVGRVLHILLGDL